MMVHESSSDARHQPGQIISNVQFIVSKQNEHGNQVRACGFDLGFVVGAPLLPGSHENGIQFAIRPLGSRHFVKLLGSRDST